MRRDRQVGGGASPPELSTVAAYGWASSDAPESCQYLAPQVLSILRGLGARTVLDLGAGNGSLCGFLKAQGFSVAGVEYDTQGYRLAAAEYPEVPFFNLGVHEAPQPILDVYPDGFDVVVSTEVVEHLYAPSLLPQFAYPLIKPGGHLVVTTPYHGYIKNLAIALLGKWDTHHTTLWEGGHIKFWSRRTLTRLLEDGGFSVRRFIGVGRMPLLWKSMVVVCIKR